uniref:Na+/phosphate symporter n=1 Tax=Desulfovibrio sp. U5L TaxID=596152 RepID=I2Q0S9_9BACT
MLSVFASFLGGMGLFFMGLKMTGNFVKSVAGRRFRDMFLLWTRSRPRGAFLGVASGLVFQSTSAVSMLLASLIGAGVTTVERGLPVLLGANVGAACLVLLAVVDIRVLVLVLLGLSGLVLSFEKPVRFLHVAGILFGVGLLLLGLGIVRVGAAPLADEPWFRAFLVSQGLPLPVYFLIGAVACMLLQSSAGVSILAITLAASGIMDGDDALMVVFGSLFGSSCLSRFYAIQLTGARKRLVMGQVLFNPVGLALFLPLFLIEHYTQTPLLLGLAAKVFPDIPRQLTAINIAFDVAAALVLLAANAPFSRLLERLCPDADGGLESLAYVKELSGVSPETALLLIDKEQGRLVGSLPRYTAELRRALDASRPAGPAARALHEAVATLCKELDECLVDMISRPRAMRSAGTIALLQDNQSVLRSLSESLRLFVEELSGPCQSEAMRRLRLVFLEALDALLLQFGDVFSCVDAADWDMLLPLLSDKGPAMERLRTRYLTEKDALLPAEQWLLMRVTGLYERCLWLLHRLGEQQRRFLSDMGEDAAAVACAARPLPSPIP